MNWTSNELGIRNAPWPESCRQPRDGGWFAGDWPDEKVKRCAVSALALPPRLDYRASMTGFIRSFAILLIAIFVAGTFALSAAPLKAETSVVMAPMAMASGGQDCAKCDPNRDMAASCDLMCALSMAGVLVGPVIHAAVLADCRFEFSDATANGQAPSSAFTPPRTIILI